MELFLGWAFSAQPKKAGTEARPVGSRPDEKNIANLV